MCCAAQENGVRANYVSILTGTTKSQFWRIRNSIIFYLKNTKVAVEVPTYQGTLHIKLKGNREKFFLRYEWANFRVFSSFFFSSFLSFRTLEKIMLGHYLLSTLTSLHKSVNFFNQSVSKSLCRRLLDEAAGFSISPSQRIFLARACSEWTHN